MNEFLSTARGTEFIKATDDRAAFQALRSSRSFKYVNGCHRCQMSHSNAHSQHKN